MSIMRCDEHGSWDSDLHEECPRCFYERLAQPAPLSDSAYDALDKAGQLRRTARTDSIICPACAHQFQAISEDHQVELRRTAQRIADGELMAAQTRNTVEITDAQPTPRTDAKQFRAETVSGAAVVVWADDMRDLERVLDAKDAEFQAANENWQFEIGMHKFTHEQLADERKAREEAEQKENVHYNRLAGLLFSGALDDTTGTQFRRSESEYINQRKRADAAEAELAAAKEQYAANSTVIRLLIEERDAERTAREQAEGEVARLRLPPSETLSEYPGCVYCMEAGTPVRLGEVCPKCGDRMPTVAEQRLAAVEAAMTKWRWGEHYKILCAVSAALAGKREGEGK